MGWVEPVEVIELVRTRKTLCGSRGEIREGGEDEMIFFDYEELIACHNRNDGDDIWHGSEMMLMLVEALANSVPIPRPFLV